MVSFSWHMDRWNTDVICQFSFLPKSSLLFPSHQPFPFGRQWNHVVLTVSLLLSEYRQGLSSGKPLVQLHRNKIKMCFGNIDAFSLELEGSTQSNAMCSRMSKFSMGRNTYSKQHNDIKCSRYLCDPYFLKNLYLYIFIANNHEQFYLIFIWAIQMINFTVIRHRNIVSLREAFCCL